MPAFGRLVAYDARDAKFPMMALLPPAPSARTYRYWNANGAWLDQGQQPHCVGYAWVHWLEDGPTTQRGESPIVNPSTLYHEAQQLDEWEGECVDQETLALSRRGWLGADDLQVGDEILTVDLEQEALRWATVQAVHRYPSKPYRVWSNGQVAIAVTDNHKWVVRNRITETGYALVPTRELKSQHLVPRAVGAWADQPDGATYDDDFVELVGWVVTEGHYRPATRRGNGIVVSQKSRRSRVLALMDRLGVAPGYDKQDGRHVWEISGALADRVRDVAPRRAPAIQWLTHLTKRQLRLFIDTCIMADGHTSIGQPNRLDRRVFTQKPGAVLDGFLAACALAGIAVSRSGVHSYTVASGAVESVETWSLRESRDFEIRQLEASPYVAGPVWCPQTKMGTFVARRGSSVFLTGNSYDGSSVRAGVKALQARGFIRSYHWAFTVDEIVQALLEVGPVVMGTHWYTGMLETDEAGFLHVEGGMVGGHAYVLNGVSVAAGVVRLKNSWSRAWGNGGHALLTLADLATLLADDGDACLAVEIRQ